MLILQWKTFQLWYWLRLLSFLFSFMLTHRGLGAVGLSVGPSSGRLWHGSSVYNGYLRGPLILTPDAERLTVGLLLPVFKIYVCSGLGWNTQPFEFKAKALTHCATATVNSIRMVQISLMKSGWIDALEKINANL